MECIVDNNIYSLNYDLSNIASAYGDISQQHPELTVSFWDEISRVNQEFKQVRVVPCNGRRE